MTGRIVVEMSDLTQLSMAHKIPPSIIMVSVSVFSVVLLLAVSYGNSNTSEDLDIFPGHIWVGRHKC